jgi:phosphinothricin acetyltransferase
VSDRIRLACADDAAAIQRIYAFYVRDTVISFETEPPSVDEMHRRIETNRARFPWLVYMQKDQIVGFAYASDHRARPAYRWSVDVTVYIHRAHRRQGIGRALYTSLFALLRLQGVVTAYAGITLPNAGSVGLHEALGFQPIGVYSGVGYKHGAWHDVGWWGLVLQPPPDRPLEPRSLTDCLADAGWHDALASGERSGGDRSR